MPLIKVKSRIEFKTALRIGNTLYGIILGGHFHPMRVQLRDAGCRNPEIFKIVPHYSSLCSSTYRLRWAEIVSDDEALNMLSTIMRKFQEHINKLP